jgi:hypothetical protein
MASSIFDLVSGEIERRTDLSTLEARGTVRLALKQSGLDARAVTSRQMAVMLERVMPVELRARGVRDAERVCETAIAALRVAHRETGEEHDAESPEAIFRRLAGG